MSLWSRLFGEEHRHTEEPHDEIQRNIREGIAVVLDVRSQEEWDVARLKNVIFIPIMELKSLPPQTVEVPGLDKSKIIYCH